MQNAWGKRGGGGIMLIPSKFREAKMSHVSESEADGRITATDQRCARSCQFGWKTAPRMTRLINPSLASSL